jgi:hypothetical protein
MAVMMGGEQDKASFLEELMNGIGQDRPDPKHGGKQVGARRK